MASRDLTFGYRRIVILLVALVVVPTFLLLAVGVVLIVLGNIQANLIMGILILALTGAAATGAILVWVFVRREANLSALQSDFVSKVSHELRTPLTSIRLFTETLRMRRGDPAAEDVCIAGLEREAMRLQDLIDRLLDWGRMESGRREFVLEPTSAADVVATAVTAFESATRRRSTILDIDIQEGPMPLEADGGALSDALLNLLTNAYKYGGDPPRILLEACVDKQRVHISVTDNGRGIPKSEHKNIFKKFYRLDDRLSREKEGSGLGLAIVHHVMRAHHGTVTVSSGTPTGSVFTLSLPLAHDAEAGEEDTEPTESA